MKFTLSNFKGDNSKNVKTRVMVLVFCTSTDDFCEVS